MSVEKNGDVDRGLVMVAKIRNPLIGKNPQSGLRPKRSDPKTIPKNQNQKYAPGPMPKGSSRSSPKEDKGKSPVKVLGGINSKAGHTIWAGK